MDTACLATLPRVLHTPGTAGPQTSSLWSPVQTAHYLVYRPFFRQNEFLTESRRLLSSRAGKLLSSKLIISPWPRAPDLALFPEVGVGERLTSGHSLHPYRSGGRSSSTWLDCPIFLLQVESKTGDGDCIGSLGCPTYQSRCISRAEKDPSPTTTATHAERKADT